MVAYISSIIGRVEFVAAVQPLLSAESDCLVGEFGLGHSSSDVADVDI